MTKDQVPPDATLTPDGPPNDPAFVEIANRYLDTLPQRQAAVAAKLDRVRRRLAELRAESRRDE